MISVIVTVYEQTRSLELLLYCLCAQEIEEPFEIIICDDGSSADVFERVCGNGRLAGVEIRYIWQSRKGHRAARSKNNGVMCARGDLLVFLDGDILVPSSFLDAHRRAHLMPLQIVCNPRRWVLDLEPRHPSPMGTTSSKSRDSQLLVKLHALACVSITQMFELLKPLSIDVDAPGQQRIASTDNSWMACLGFSFSIRHDGEIKFDEAFVGWGPEDREFVLRMVRLHDYAVIFMPEIEVFHLERCSTGRTPFSLLPTDPTQIVSYLQNMIYFASLFPDDDLSLILSSLMAYEFRPETQRWELSPVYCNSQMPQPYELASQVRRIAEWLKKENLLIAGA